MAADAMNSPRKGAPKAPRRTHTRMVAGQRMTEPLADDEVVHEARRLRLRVVDGQLEALVLTPELPPGISPYEWEPLSPRALLYYPADSHPWRWLRAQGIRRPSPSGRSGQRVAPRAAQINYRPSPAARARLDELVAATGESQSAALDRLLLGNKSSP